MCIRDRDDTGLDQTPHFVEHPAATPARKPVGHVGNPGRHAFNTATGRSRAAGNAISPAIATDMTSSTASSDRCGSTSGIGEPYVYFRVVPARGDSRPPSWNLSTPPPAP